MDIARCPLPKGLNSIVPTRGVIHSMAEFVSFEGREYYAIDWLRKKGWSAHAFVAPSGTVIRSRENHQGAYHAKARRHNYFSLGLEFLVAGVHDITSLYGTIKNPYLTPEQYRAGVDFVRQEWVEDLGILDYVRHSMIDPANKQDPGKGFPFDLFMKDIGVAV